MGFGPFSSESSNRLETVSTAMNAGFSEVGGAATNVSFNLGSKTKVGKGGTLSPIINLTDQGAINAALAISDKSIRSVEQFGQNLTGLVDGIAAAIRGQGQDVIEAVTAANKAGIAGVTEANRTELENIAVTAVKWGALALAGYFAARALWSMK